MKENKKASSVAVLSITAAMYLIAIVIIMSFMLQQNGSAQVQNNSNDNNTSSSTNSTTNTKTTTPNSISLPLSKGYVKGKIAHFIATDASDNQTAASITNDVGFKVNFAPALTLISEAARQQGYEFLNGIRGEGSFGFQLPIASALPGDKNYSPIVQLNFVKWNFNSTNSVITARELKSVDEIMDAQKNHEIAITKTNILINSPAVR